MKYKLSDGIEIDLQRVRDISPIRDLGIDPDSIDKSILAFTIRLRSGDPLQIKEYYHYSDWAVAHRKLKSIRTELVTRWQAVIEKDSATA